MNFTSFKAMVRAMQKHWPQFKLMMTVDGDLVAIGSASGPVAAVNDNHK